jgi:hypothetical protein
MFQDQVDQCGAGLKPAAGETEGWSRHFLHAEHIHVKAATAGKIPDNECDVIKPQYCDDRGRH